MPAACVAGDGYCTGYTGFGAGVNVITTAGTEGAYTPTTTGNHVALGAGGTAFIKESIKIACPTNTANTGQSAPFTIYKCLVTNGKYVSTAAGTATAVISACP